MHTQTQLNVNQFAIRSGTAPTTFDQVFPGWHKHDRFGLVIHDALGGVGASHLLQLAIWAYYNADQRRRSDLAVYPEIYAVHVGGGHGSHADYDFWGPRREIILGSSPGGVLAALNERGITRLAVPEVLSAGADPVLEPKEVAAFHDLVVTAFAYSPTGRTSGADLEIAGLDPRTEQNPSKVLDAWATPPPASPMPVKRARRPLKELDAAFYDYQRARAAELTADEVELAVHRRKQILCDGLATETYRKIEVGEALRSLVPAGEGP